MKHWRRVLRNIFGGWFTLRIAFPKATRDAIRTAIAQSESVHLGEICFAVESRLPLAEVLRGLTPRRRAVQLFAGLGVWETEANSGVLIYVLLAEHVVEIYADRGIARRVSSEHWETICAEMSTRFQRGEFEAGSIAGIHGIERFLIQHFPVAGKPNRNELGDAPIVL